MPYLGIFWLEFLKNCHIWNESLTHTLNFDIGSAFSKGLGFAFYEGPSLLYEVCLFQFGP